MAQAAPPPNAGHDPAISAWFKAQHNRNGGHCCDEADGRTTAYRVSKAGNPAADFEAWLATDENHWPDGKALCQQMAGREDGCWIPVPNETLGQEEPNPTGEFVLFWRVYNGVLCARLPAEG